MATEGEVAFNDYLSQAYAMSDRERSIVLRAINTERNNLVKWYAVRAGHEERGKDSIRPSFYADGLWEFKYGNQVFDEQVAALNAFEARLLGCECCFNNADDFEHYHSPVCSPDYREPPFNDLD